MYNPRFQVALMGRASFLGILQGLGGEAGGDDVVEPSAVGGLTEAGDLCPSDMGDVRWGEGELRLAWTGLGPTT